MIVQQLQLPIPEYIRVVVLQNPNHISVNLWRQHNKTEKYSEWHIFCVFVLRARGCCLCSWTESSGNRVFTRQSQCASIQISCPESRGQGRATWITKWLWSSIWYYCQYQKRKQSIKSTSELLSYKILAISQWTYQGSITQQNNTVNVPENPTLKTIKVNWWH